MNVSTCVTPRHHVRVPPELRRAPIHELTLRARSFSADFAVELEQDVSRADQPELVHCIELDRVAECKDARSADERDVVKVDDVESLREDRADPRGLEGRIADLLCREWRQESKPAGQPVHRDRRIDGRHRHRPARSQGAIRVGAVNHLHVVPAIGERMGQPLDENSVAAEVVRRIKRRDHAEPQRTAHRGDQPPSSRARARRRARHQATRRLKAGVPHDSMAPGI